MSVVSGEPRIYHITHVDNLPAIVEEGALVCDAEMVRRGGPKQAIGLSRIKRRRIEEIEVTCHPDTRVGDYVPFYFCSRSVMLYVIHRANHPELSYRGGQGKIVHLEADLDEVIGWAGRDGIRWAFSLSNAGAYYVELRTGRDRLGELDWKGIAARDWREDAVKEAKQAEFLVHERFPWDLVRRVGVRSRAVQERVEETLRGSSPRPLVEVRIDWYY